MNSPLENPVISVFEAVCADVAALLGDNTLAVLSTTRAELRELGAMPFTDWLASEPDKPTALLLALALPLVNVNNADEAALVRLTGDLDVASALMAERPYHSLRITFQRHGSLMTKRPALRRWLYHAGYTYDSGVAPFRREFSPCMSHLVVSDANFSPSELASALGLKHEGPPAGPTAVFTRLGGFLLDADIRAISAAYPSASTLPLLRDELGGKFLVDPRGLDILFEGSGRGFAACCKTLGLEPNRTFSANYGYARFKAEPRDPSALFRVLQRVSARADVEFAEPHIISE